MLTTLSCCERTRRLEPVLPTAKAAPPATADQDQQREDRIADDDQRIARALRPAGRHRHVLGLQRGARAARRDAFLLHRATCRSHPCGRPEWADRARPHPGPRRLAPDGRLARRAPTPATRGRAARLDIGSAESAARLRAACSASRLGGGRTATPRDAAAEAATFGGGRALADCAGLAAVVGRGRRFGGAVAAGRLAAVAARGDRERGRAVAPSTGAAAAASCGSRRQRAAFAAADGSGAARP